MSNLVKQLEFKQRAESLSLKEIYNLTPAVETVCLKLYAAYMIANSLNDVGALTIRAWENVKVLGEISTDKADEMFCEILLAWIGTAEITADKHEPENIDKKFYQLLDAIKNCEISSDPVDSEEMEA